jgi:hypothetical protein
MSSKKGSLSVNASGYTTLRSHSDRGMDFMSGETSASQFRWFADETQVMTLSAAGLVGIGTTSPVADLHVSEAGADEVRIQMTNSATGDTSSDGFAIVMAANGTDTYLYNYESSGKIIFGTANSTRMTIDGNGIVTKSAQPAFLAQRLSGILIADGVWTNLVFDSERFDIGGNYNTSNGIFTAPVTGKYFLNATVRIDGLNNIAAHVSIQFDADNVDMDYQAITTPTIWDSGASYYAFTITALIDMDASDTVLVKAYFNGTTGTFGGYQGTQFSGYLVS